MKYEEMKIKVDSPEHSKDIQEALFSMGYRWAGEGVRNGVCLTEQPYLFTLDCGDICFAECGEYFEAEESREVFLEDLLGNGRGSSSHKYSEELKAIAEGIQVQMYSDVVEKWMDIPEAQALYFIATKPQNKFRVKPEKKLVRQWEFKYLSRTGAVITSWEPTQKKAIETCEWHTEEFGRKIINEPILVEYEVEL